MTVRVERGLDQLVKGRYKMLGTEAHIALSCETAGSLALAEGECRRLDRRWNATRPESEIAHLNSAREGIVVLAPELYGLIEAVIEARRAAFGELDDFELLPSSCAVMVPAGARFCLGRIVHAAAADALAGVLAAAGARGVCVNVGGYVRAVGVAPGVGPWVLSPVAEIGWSVVLAAGALSSSTGGPDHVVGFIGRPLCRREGERLVSVTVIAERAVQTAVLADAAVGMGLTNGRWLLEQLDVAAVLLRANGELVEVGNVREFRA